MTTDDRMFWCGKPIDEMSRDDLIIIASQLGKELATLRNFLISNIQLTLTKIDYRELLNKHMDSK